ncbi:MAG: ribosome-associated translation inhibitor RaiA [Lentisphaeria bacterium]|nr:ribosome-associated translation inhibitor RaiA [Lentisphaeria bacterium]
MEVIISGRHLDVTEDLHGYIEERTAKLELEDPKLTSIRVVLSHERNWHIAEMHVHGKHLALNAKSEMDDMYASIDSVFEKLHRQLRKHLDKLHDHRVDKDAVNDGENDEESTDAEDESE